MTQPTEHDGILFYEEVPPQAILGESISVSLGGLLRSSQLLGVSAVKSALAKKAKGRGGNAVVGFTYGQRSAGLLGSVLSRDDVVWYGKGAVAKMPLMAVKRPRASEPTASEDIVVTLNCQKCNAEEEVSVRQRNTVFYCRKCRLGSSASEAMGS